MKKVKIEFSETEVILIRRIWSNVTDCKTAWVTKNPRYVSAANLLELTALEKATFETIKTKFEEADLAS